MSDESSRLQGLAEKLSIGEYQRHVFLCTGAKCCSEEVGLAAWEMLKQELKDTGISAGPGCCFRTKVGCLRVCSDGPIVVVYPEGTWYAGMTAARIPRLVQEHLLADQPIADWIFARNPLPS